MLNHDLAAVRAALGELRETADRVRARLVEGVLLLWERSQHEGTEILSQATTGPDPVEGSEVLAIFNIRGAALRAMTRAVAALSVRPHFALIDGRDLPDGLVCPGRPIIDGDALSMSIAAASIVAKTMRDALMRNLGLEYPQYGFGDHVGYATVAHRRALASAGPCPYHRRSFRLEPQQE